MHLGAYAILQTKKSIFLHWARREIVGMKSGISIVKENSVTEILCHQVRVPQ